MLVVVFGAGASYDSFEDVPPARPNTADWIAAQRLRPPLAAELFDRRFERIMDLYPSCRAIMSGLRNAAHQPGAPIEQAMQALQGEAEAGDDERKRQLMALRYYIRDAIEGVTSRWTKEITHGATNY